MRSFLLFISFQVRCLPWFGTPVEAYFTGVGGVRVRDISATATTLLLTGGSGAKGSRTPDLLNAIQALYQLSYGPER